jgi:hypothetical protein
MQCESCGFCAERPDLFRQAAQSFRRKTRTLCLQCYASRDDGVEKVVFWGWFVLWVPALVLCIVLPNTTLGPSLLNLGLVQLYMFVSTVLHELGHALAGRLAKFRIFAIEIGKGRVFKEFLFLGFRWQFRTIPLGGFAHGATRTVQWFRLRETIFVLGGPLANGLLLVGAIALLPFDDRIDGILKGFAPAKWLLYTNAVMLVYSLFPHHADTSYGKLPNDGLLLWQTWRRSRAEIEHIPYWFYLREAAELRLRGNLSKARSLAAEGVSYYRDDLNLPNFIAHCFLDEGRFSEALGIYRRLLEKHGQQPDSRALLLNGIAFANLMIGDPALLAEADEASRQALEHAPLSMYYKGTRGCVLIELGQHEAGIQLLQEAMLAHTENYALALDACFIAIGAARSGNPELAHDNVAHAKKLDPKCWMLERAIRELDQAQKP